MIGTNLNIKRRVWDMQYPIVGGGAVPRSCYFFLSFFSLISFLINSFMYLDLGIIPISLLHIYTGRVLILHTLSSCVGM